MCHPVRDAGTGSQYCPPNPGLCRPYRTGDLDSPGKNGSKRLEPPGLWKKLAKSSSNALRVPREGVPNGETGRGLERELEGRCKGVFFGVLGISIGERAVEGPASLASRSSTSSGRRYGARDEYRDGIGAWLWSMKAGDMPCLENARMRGDLNGEKLNSSASRSSRRCGGVDGKDDEGGYSGVEGLSSVSSTSEYAEVTIVVTSTSDNGEGERVDRPDAACSSIARMISSTLAVMDGGVTGRAMTGATTACDLDGGLVFVGLLFPAFFLGVRKPYRVVAAARLSSVGDGGGGRTGIGCAYTSEQKSVK